MNAGSDNEQDQEVLKDLKSKLSGLPIEYLKRLVDKIRSFYEAIGNEFDPHEEFNYYSNADLQMELANPSYGQDTLKHLRQTSALIGAMERLELLRPKSCFIEFGAGKGQMSFYLANSMEAFHDSSVLLIDRASMRFKLDNKCKDRSIIHRMRADIADLDLKAVEGVKGKDQIVGISKHLCGAATDLAIRCMARVRNEEQQQALVIAVCCHHRCTWQSFVGKTEFRKHNLTAKDFQFVIKMVSWAVCGGGMSRERRRLIEDQSGQEIDQEEVKLPWTKVEQEAIGYQCKRIIDYSRLQYLKDQGYHTGAFYYISKDVTLENLCIFAKHSPRHKTAD